MSDATDDLEILWMFGTSTPVRDMDGVWYTYVYEGVKYRFRTVREANEWASSRGFKLDIKKAKGEKKREEIAELQAQLGEK